MENLTKYFKSISKFLLSHIFTILCFVFLCYISFKFEYFLYNKKQFVVSAISLILLMHICSKMRFNIIFTLFFTIVVTTNCYFAFHLGSYINAGLFGSIMDTNENEIISMSKDIIIDGIAMLAVSFFLIFMSVRELKKDTVPIKYSIIGLAFFVLIISPYNAYKYVEDKIGLDGTETTEHPLVIAEIGYQRTAPILYGNIATLINYFNERIKYKNFFILENKAIPEGLTLTADTTQLPNKIYLILGESATRNHMSLYGYDYMTTPYVDSLATHDKNFAFYEGFSPGIITRDALRQILTAASPHDMDEFLKSKSLLDLANDRGYETVWAGPFEGVIRQHSGTYLQLLAHSAQVYYYESEHEDFNLIHFAKDTLDVNKKQFFVFNLNGSHGAYKDGTDESDVKALPENGKLEELTVHYNRSIHHTDRFLKQVHELMAMDSSAVMIYMSDHGEVVGKGHGLTYGRNQIEIPLMSINNSERDLDAITQKYMFNYNGKKALNSLSVFYILSEVLGYAVSDTAREKAIKESEYVYMTDRRVIPAKDLKD